MIRKIGMALLLTLLSVGMLLPERAVEASAPKYVESTVNGLNVRSSASVKSKAIGVLHKGQKVAYVQTTGNWIKVKYKGKQAFVAKRYTKFGGVAKANSTVQVAKAQRTLTMKASAYTPFCKGCSGKTALGWDLRKQKRNVIAVDPRVIPLGSKVQVFVNGRLLGTYTAADTGGSIRGHKIDIAMYSYKQAIQFGRQTVTVKVL